jgi:hypothetical protein
VAGSLREGLGKVADVVDIWGAPEGRAAACDAVLAMDCASLVPEPYFIYLCTEQGVRHSDRVVYERAVGLFAENSRLARSFAESMGIPRDKIHVIPPALTAHQDSPRVQPPYLREAPRRKLLLCVSERSGQDVSLKSMRLVHDALDILRREYDSRISLTISGLENWPASGSPPDGVAFQADPPVAEWMALFDSHDLLVVPPGIEFVGLPETLSRGVPCVAARSSEMSEAIMPAVTGALIDGGDARELAEAVASILGNDAFYRDCYQWAPAMAAYFSWERVARQVAYVISREVGFSVLLDGDGPRVLVKFIRDDPGTARCLNLRVPAANLGKKVRHEQQDGTRCLLDQFPRADDGNVGARHPKTLLGRGCVGDRGQEVVIDSRLAQQCDRPGRRPVAYYAAASGALRAEPAVNGTGAGGHVLLKASHDGRVQHSSGGLGVNQAADGAVGVGAIRSVVIVASGEEHGATVEVELPRGVGAEAHLGQHSDQGGGGVVGIVPMTERVPLPGADDRIQGVVLQEKDPAGREARRTLGKGSRLVGRVHHAEAVEDDVRLRADVGWLESPRLQHPYPGATVGAAILRDACSCGQQARRRYPLDRVRRLFDQGRRLSALRLFGDGRVIEQLGEAAA